MTSFLKLLRTGITASLLLLVSIVQAQSMGRVPGEYLLHTESEAVLQDILRTSSLWEGQPTGIHLASAPAPQSNIWHLKVDHTVIHEVRFLEYLRSRRGVIAAQFNHIVHWRNTPNDAAFSDQWQWLNTGQTGGTPGADIRITQAWDITTGGLTTQGDTIVIAVVDDGVNLNHPDLTANLWVNHGEIPNNGIDDDGNGYIDDYRGWNTTQENDNIGIGGNHGTPVSGMIGAIGNNTIGVSGVNWVVKIMTIRPISTNEATIVASYNYALTQRKIYNETQGQQGAFVVAINSSWGINYGQPADAPIWCAFYDTMGVHGILNAAATANLNIDIDVDGDLPTACPSPYLISVTSTNHLDQKATAAWGKNSIDLGAPGQAVHTTRNNGNYGNSSGTSFASPLVAGLVGLLYSTPCPYLGGMAIADPAGTALLVKNAILEGVDVIPALQNITLTGGRVNAYKSVLNLLQSCTSCPSPFNIIETVQDATSAWVTWSDPGDAQSFELRWRIEGNTEWNLITAATSPTLLEDLLPGRRIDVQIKAICSDEDSDYTPRSFYTEILCFEPENIGITILDTNAVEISWDNSSTTEYVHLYYREQGENMFLPLGPFTELSALLEDLTPCTNYDFYLEAVCEGGLTGASDTLSFSTPGCADCSNLQVCPSSANSSSSEYIQSVQIGALNNVSGNNGGYAFFPSTGVEFKTNHKYLYTLTPGFPSSQFNQAWRVWIDLNQDGDFDDPGEMIIQAGPSALAMSGLFTMPANALPGATMMRVSMSFSSFPNACGNFSFGEVEDYCIHIALSDEPCDFPDMVTLTAASASSALISWTNIPGTTGYEIEYRPEGGDWTLISKSSPPLQIPGLTACTNYEVRVRSLCDNEESVWSPSLFFVTKGCGACKDLNYCASTTTNSSSQWIQEVHIAGVQHVSGNNGGYGFFDNLPITLFTNFDYELIIKPGTIFGINQNYYRVYIDYNQNGTFNPVSELIGTSDQNNSDEVIFPFEVPNDAVEGTTRLRIVMQSFFSDNSPCISTGTGEVEDYCVQIIAADPPCIPRPVLIDSAYNGGIVLGWKQVIPASVFLVEYRISGEPTWTEVSTTQPGITLSNLASCTDYEVRMRTVCEGDTTEFSPVLKFKSFGCGACRDYDYCELRGQDSSIEWIESVELNTLNHVSGTDNGYAFFEDVTTSLDTGGVYTITVTPGFNGSGFTEQFRAWIDFNQNGEFEPNEIILTGSSDMAVSNTFTVPGVPLGETRLRVVMSFSSTIPTCGNFFYGEVEDYCISLKAGEVPCLIPGWIDTLNVTVSSASVLWDSVETSIGYMLRMRELGATQWAVETALVNNSYVFNNLKECTEYEVQLLSICQNKLSEAETIIFRTACISSLSPSEVSALRAWPNPFSEVPNLEFVIGKSQAYTLQVFDARGVLLSQEQLSLDPGPFHRPLESLRYAPTGLYLVRILEATGATATLRLMKQ